jgi:creatinine amidohydrolase/Fe(II)-dependent formamide hydrolase-like protein
MNRPALLSLFLLLGGLTRAADAPVTFTSPSVFLEELTWPEVRQALDAGYRRILIPTGGTEQGGAHVMLGKHNRIVHYTAEQIARKLGHTLVAPVLAYVPEQVHLPFPGTISLSEDTFAAVLKDSARSLKLGGFRQIYFLGDSYHNQAPQEKVEQALAAEFARAGVRLATLNEYYDHRFNGQVDWLKTQGYSEPQIGGHVGIRDTSELMAVYPEGVRKEKLKDSPAGDLSGANGDATKASTDYGRKMLELKIQAALRQISRIERTAADRK